MNEPWWTDVVQWAIFGIVMTIIMGWIAKGRHKRRPAADGRQMVHSPAILILGLVGFIFFAAIAVVSNVFANETTTWWTTAIFVGFAVLSLPMIADYFFARHALSEEGLSYGRMNGSRGNLRWSDVRRVKYSQSLKWFRIETSTGAVARISAMLTGLPEFARLLLAHTRPTAFDPVTLRILKETAAGNPPSVWG